MNLVVLHKLPASKALWDQSAKSCWRVLSFADRDVEADFLDCCKNYGITVEKVERAVDYIDEASRAAREKYSEFVASWPTACRVRGKSFKEHFTHLGEISYWWLTWASMKDNEVSCVFQYLCYLEIVEKVFRQAVFQQCILVSEDSLMSLLLKRWCAKSGVRFVSFCSSRLGRGSELLRGIAGRIALLVSLLWKLVCFRLLIVSKARKWRKPTVAFFTLYPGPLKIEGEILVDRNYRELPEYTSSHSKLEAALLVWCEGRFFRGFTRLWRERKRLSECQNPRLAIVDGYLRVSDLGIVLKNFVFFFQYLLLDCLNRRFRESFIYEGLNVYELVGKEFKRWFLGSQLAYHLVIARAVGRAVNEENIRYLVCFLELYPLARALYYGVKKANPSVVTIAYQHANINLLKLWYGYRPEELRSSLSSKNGPYLQSMPIPDRYFFQGRHGMDILVHSGYPRERCCLIGSPRYDDLGIMVSRMAHEGASLSEVGNPAPASLKKKVLVVPALSRDDAQQLISACVRVCSQGIQCSLLVKPHPDCPVDDFVENAKKRYSYTDVKVVSGNIHELIRSTDAVITSYSTAGDEAVALNRPVICYAGLQPCMASLLQVAAAPIVRTTEDLFSTLRGMLFEESYREIYLAKREELIEGSFYRLDGRATERFLQALLCEHPVR